MVEKNFTGGSLAVRMRPNKFEDVIGQAEAVAVLKGILNSIKLKEENTPRTIIITGAPGLGKTTLARMFARYVNCEIYDACGKCGSCKNPNYIEINVGSERKIDDVREIVEMARYSSLYTNIKVFILDEVHNLTGPAEQAFLKPAEEPPPGAIYILCTSEPDKMSVAMMRRGPVLELKCATVEELGALLIKIAGKEKVKLDNKSVKKICYDIADECSGQIGLAISVLGKVLLAIKGSVGIDPKEIYKKVYAEIQSPVELAAASCCFAFLELNRKLVCKQAFSVESCRQLLIKMRSVAMAVVQDNAGKRPYNIYVFKEFKKSLASAEIEYVPKTLAPKMYRLLTCLNNIELKMNQVSGISAQPLFVAELCRLITAMKNKKRLREHVGNLAL